MDDHVYLSRSHVIQNGQRLHLCYCLAKMQYIAMTLQHVFRQKLKSLISFITKSHVFGPTRCWMYSVEWQKRGLPHAHILVWFIDKIRPEEIDSIISAEIPDPSTDQLLFDIVTTNMIHGPCGTLNSSSPCMADGKCTKFP
ncbi:hypothetical protein EVAR_87565_1 [Eumeta japonica]|uniref:Helitron helicase-like domain-containing protein n=1 Tax=Eumeta variegata TaxID=151549 RepID=A0A4C1WMU9_EUMVA|nr:hypothetical protein EVAR_87565_1 [Eumeta japonica]